MLIMDRQTVHCVKCCRPAQTKYTIRVSVVHVMPVFFLTVHVFTVTSTLGQHTVCKRFINDICCYQCLHVQPGRVDTLCQKGLLQNTWFLQAVKISWTVHT